MCGMKNTFDLQIQSTASDGRHTPTEIVTMATEEQLSVIAITDHDSVAGVAAAIHAAVSMGIRVIPGIEMSVEEHGVHLLGFGINYENQTLLSELARMREERIASAQKMVANLKAAGFIIEWNEVAREASGDVVARPHIARALLLHAENGDKLGNAASTHDVIERVLTDTSPYYVSRAHIIAKDAIALIHSAGGLAAWSHPAIHFRDDYEGLEKFLQELIAWGLEGMEIFNPSHTEDDVEFLESLAVRYRMLRTAGSDFHEKGPHLAGDNGLHSARTVGDYETYGFPTDMIIAELDVAIARHKRVSL